MKQLFVLVTGLLLMVACSNDHNDDVISIPTEISDDGSTVSWKGNFEGEWRLSYYGATCDGNVEVNDSMFVFQLPSEYVLPRLGIVNELTKSYYPNEPFYTTTSGYTYLKNTQHLRFTIQGYSKEAIYSMISDDPLSFGVKADGTDYRIDLKGVKEQPTAVFDMDSGLWTLALTIDEITINNLSTGREIVVTAIDENRSADKSAWLLVFRARKRIER